MKETALAAAWSWRSMLKKVTDLQVSPAHLPLAVNDVCCEYKFLYNSRQRIHHWWKGFIIIIISRLHLHLITFLNCKFLSIYPRFLILKLADKFSWSWFTQMDYHMCTIIKRVSFLFSLQKQEPVPNKEYFRCGYSPPPKQVIQTCLILNSSYNISRSLIGNNR